jgi:hypothetical protein
VPAATAPAQRKAAATSTEQAPVQTFHWVHYPPNVIAGTYTVTAMLFKTGSEAYIKPGPTATATADLVNQGHPGESQVAGCVRRCRTNNRHCR